MLEIRGIQSCTIIYMCTVVISFWVYDCSVRHLLQVGKSTSKFPDIQVVIAVSVDGSYPSLQVRLQTVVLATKPTTSSESHEKVP